jgi:protein PET100
MAGPNLEVFKVRPQFPPFPSHPLTFTQFGMYILFPITIMYYFGTNLDGKFTVPEFWPKPGQTHRIPYEREEIAKELERLKARNLENKRRREEEERMRREMGGGSE